MTDEVRKNAEAVAKSLSEIPADRADEVTAIVNSYIDGISAGIEYQKTVSEKGN